MAGSSPVVTARLTKRAEPRVVAAVALAVLAVLSLALVLVRFVPAEDGRAALQALAQGLSSHGFWSAAAVGLAAQTVDGALGMAYGITSTTFLLSTGVPPAAASASVHVAEIFTTAFSGASHWRLGNVDGALFRRLLIPGVIGRWPAPRC